MANTIPMASRRRGWRRNTLLLVVAVALCVVSVSAAFYEDPHKVLGLKRSASEAEIKRAYRTLALKWHPDKNPGNPDAEKEFMRIGAAYDQLMNGGGSSPQQQRNGYGYGNGYQNGRGWSQQQQWQWQQQQQRQRQYYQQQQSMPSVFPFSFTTMAVVAVLVWVMIILPSYMQSDSSTSASSGQQQAKSAKADTTKKTEESRASPHEQIARVFAPSLYAFNPLYLTARGRRLVLFFPDPNAFGNNARDQFASMEKLAAEHSRDPLTFCWLDLATLPNGQQATWKAQFKQTTGSSDSPLLAVFTSKGKKISAFAPSRSAKLELDDARKWISRLLGGEIAQEEALATLFTT